MNRKTRHAFAGIQNQLLLHQRSMIYRNNEMEVPNRDGEMTFYNFSYARKQKQQTVHLQQG